MREINNYILKALQDIDEFWEMNGSFSKQNNYVIMGDFSFFFIDLLQLNVFGTIKICEYDAENYIWGSLNKDQIDVLFSKSIKAINELSKINNSELNDILLTVFLESIDDFSEEQVLSIDYIINLFNKEMHQLYNQYIG